MISDRRSLCTQEFGKTKIYTALQEADDLSKEVLVQVACKTDP